MKCVCAHLDCDKDPGDANGNAGDAEKVAQIETENAEQRSEENGERTKKPSKKG